MNEKKKIVYVAHEFGLFKGHGGIAKYLYTSCKYLLELNEYEVFALAGIVDDNCDLLSNPNFKMIKLNGSIENQRQEVLHILNKIQPDFVEFSEFQALGLDCVLAKQHKGYFKNTVLTSNNHTATKECFEWSNMIDFSNATPYLQLISQQEKQQLELVDYCLAASTFLAEYIKKNYNIDRDFKVLGYPYFNDLKNKQTIIEENKNYYNYDDYKDSFNIVLVTRFEGRKHQDLLLNAVQSLRKKGYNIKLFLVGNSSSLSDGTDYRTLMYEQLTNKEGIYFFDFMNMKQQENLIAIADLTVMPSVFENQPMAMFESVLRGVPVMASKYSGIMDYTKDEILSFNPFEPNDIENKILQFYSLTKDEREQIRLNQYNCLLNFIDIKKTIYERVNLPLISKNDKLDENLEFLKEKV